MKTRSIIGMISPPLAVLAMLFAGSAGAAEAGRETVCFDRDWKFHLGDAAGAETPALDDSAWRALDLPHDWSIEGPFDADSPAHAGGGYLTAGTGWYRKAFTLPEADNQRRVFLQFDGVYMDADVWINGHHLGNHPYGYTSFEYDLTPHVHFGTAGNVLAVRASAHQPCSRWYSGAAIYRHVWLTRTQPVHVDHWGTYVTTPKVSETAATVQVQTLVRNDGATDGGVTFTTILLRPDGKEVARRCPLRRGGIQPGDTRLFRDEFTIEKPQLWAPEHPRLYQAVCEVRVGSTLLDRYPTAFGIRTIQFTADRGFILNGRHVQIKGVCNHHDLGCLGTAVSRRALERQLEILQAMGCNAIRTSHNPPAPELLDLCDRMGFLVMDEAFDEWKQGKTRFGYGRFFDAWSERDLVSMLQRDRNHPSVILWSIGNEIPEQNDANAGAMAKRLADICHREDPTRPVTSACTDLDHAIKNGYVKALDVFGINYRSHEYKKRKGAVLLGSETASAISSRGQYDLTPNNKDGLDIQMKCNTQCTSYDLLAVPWGCTAEASLTALRNCPWVAGEFVWTGFDYIGEPTPYKWPARSSYFGIVDLCGFPKDRYYLYQSQWSDKPMVHVLPHWNWQGFEAKAIPVWCFSNADSVELFLNGKSLGEKGRPEKKNLRFPWSVPYAPGTLKAVAKKDGKVVATDEVRTAGKPARLVVKPDRQTIRADGEDLAFVEVRIMDADGNLCPNADNTVVFGTEGPATLAGVDNGDATNHESFKGRQHKAFHGLCLAVLKARRETGQLRLTATAAGLPSETVMIGVQPESP